MNQHYTNAVTVLQGADSNPWIVSGTITTSPDVNIHDSAGNALNSTSGSLNVSVVNAVSVLQSGTWNINNISGTISLPTGAATNNALTTINTTLGSPFQAGGLIGNTSFEVTQGTSPWVVSGTVSPSITSDRVVTGSITTLNQLIAISTEGCGAVTIQLSGSGFATITFEQLSGNDWLPLCLINVRELPSIIYDFDNSLDTTGLWQANCAGIGQIRVNCTSYTSGSIDVVLEASIGSARDVTFSPSSSLTVAQGQATSAPGAWPIKITDGSATVGVTSTRLNTSAAQSGAWSVAVNNLPATQPVSGTVGVTQTTSPWVVGQSTPSALNATVIGTGTFAVQATLAAETTKVIGTVNQGTSPWVTSFSAPQHVIADTGSTTAVTGNVTVVQPTGTSLHVVVDSAPSTAVTNAGTFAVQATLTAETTKVIGTVNQGTSPWVTSFSTPQHVINDASSAVIGHIISDTGSTTAVTGNVTAVQATGSNLHVVVDTAPSTAVTNAGTFVVQATLAAETTKVIGTINNFPATVSTNSGATGASTIRTASNLYDGSGTALTTTSSNLDINVKAVNGGATGIVKGTQNLFGFNVQQIHDAGRVHVNFYASGAASGSTGTETAITLTRSSGTSATTTGTSFVVTSGKTYRITSITFGTRGNATGTAEVSTFNFRINTGGAVVTTSTPVTLQARSGAAATALAYDRIAIDLGGDGYEVVGDGTLQIGVTANSVFTTNAPTWDVLITGYEY